MDPSALIFIGLALAWACYLVPKALEHHEEGARTRSIDRFSRRMRILARREPRGRKRTELVTAPPAERKPPEPATMLVPKVLTPADRRARRRAAVRAARRRRRVLDLLLVANVVVGALAILAVLRWEWQGVPAGLVVLWLVVCRVSVRRARRPVMERRPVVLDPTATGEVTPASAALAAGFHLDDVTDEIARIVDTDATTDASGWTGISAVIADPAPSPTAAPVGGWELQPLVVPTYVAKDRAARSVRTIDLDSTGVWSSGRSAADSALVREKAAPTDPTPGAAGTEPADERGSASAAG